MLTFPFNQTGCSMGREMPVPTLAVSGRHLSSAGAHPIAFARWLGFAGLLCGAAAVQPALAATPGSADDQGSALQEIVVSAQRREENLQVVPISMSAITGDTLSNLGITRFD